MTAPARPLVHIVLLHWKNYPHTRECLESLRAVTYGNFRVVIVDNDSGDGSVERLEAEFPECLYVRNAENLGFSRGCNRGIAAALEAGADYVLLLNNDMAVGPGFLDPAVDAAESDRRIGLVTGKIMRRDRPELIWHAGGHIDMLRVMGVPRGNNEVDRGQYDQPCDTEWASGAMMLMRRALLEDIGLLPEEYFFGQEEWDFSTAALRAGWRIRYVPEFAGVHDQGGSYAPGHPVLIVYNGGRNKLIYAEKYLPRILWQPWRALYWLYLRVWWPRRARWHGSTASDYKARIVAADLAFRDHTRGARVQLADLLAAGQKIGPTVSWGSNWARQG